VESDGRTSKTDLRRICPPRRDSDYNQAPCACQGERSDSPHLHVSRENEMCEAGTFRFYVCCGELFLLSCAQDMVYLLAVEVVFYAMHEVYKTTSKGVAGDENGSINRRFTHSGKAR